LQWNTGARLDDRARADLRASDGRQFEQSRAGAHTAALKSPGAACLYVTDRATDRATKKVKKAPRGAPVRVTSPSPYADFCKRGFLCLGTFAPC